MKFSIKDKLNSAEVRVMFSSIYHIYPPYACTNQRYASTIFQYGNNSFDF